MKWDKWWMNFWYKSMPSHEALQVWNYNWVNTFFKHLDLIWIFMNTVFIYDREKLLNKGLAKEKCLSIGLDLFYGSKYNTSYTCYTHSSHFFLLIMIHTTNQEYMETSHNFIQFKRMVSIYNLTTPYWWSYEVDYPLLSQGSKIKWC